MEHQSSSYLIVSLKQNMNSNIGRKYVDVKISWVFEIELPLVTNVTNTL